MAPVAMTAAGRDAVKRARTTPAPGAGTPPRTSSERAAAAPPRAAALSGTRVASPTRTATPDHRRRVARPSAPTMPRRVSGPARGRVAPRPAMAGGGAVIPAIDWAPRVRYPRTPKRPHIGTTLPKRAIAYVRALPDHALLDRIVRGRTWIALLGVMLVGIVAMQVEMLKLGASMGRSIEQTSTLQSKNEVLRASVASLSDEVRIEKLAAQQGMVMPGPTQIGFLAGSGRLEQALSHIQAPNTATFVAAATSTGAIATSADANSYSASPQANYTP